MKKFIALLAVALFIASSAHAIEIDAQCGVTKYTKVANGNWYQNGFPNSEKLASPTCGVQALTDADTHGIQYGFGAGNYGEYKVDAQVLDFDANYNENSPTHCNGPCQPLSHIKGWGNIPYYELVARKTFNNGVFIGASLVDTRASWHVTNYNWVATPPYGNAGPIQFTIYHEVVNKLDLTLSIGYHITPSIRIVLEAVPTHAPNDQPVAAGGEEGAAGTRTYYRLLTKGYSPRLLLEYTALKF